MDLTTVAGIIRSYPKQYHIKSEKNESGKWSSAYYCKDANGLSIQSPSLTTTASFDTKEASQKFLIDLVLRMKIIYKDYDNQRIKIKVGSRIY